jgi:hypothetical protein
MSKFEFNHLPSVDGEYITREGMKKTKSLKKIKESVCPTAIYECLLCGGKYGSKDNTTRVNDTKYEECRFCGKMTNILHIKNIY